MVLDCHRIENCHEWKSRKVGVARANLADTMLSHEHGGVNVMQNVATYAR